ncbi:hypothetical protein [uncultured Jatrophihabitans sp.]|uniref:hypothetical protein n=1 Tax=uncultured Jatrophihabitans sp. TaxID=1610747 RepID=UPI0035CBF68C
MESDRYVAAVEKRLAKQADPVTRARAANDEITALAYALEKMGVLRADAVRAAREQMSAVDVAAALGVSRARVYQIAAE